MWDFAGLWLVCQTVVAADEPKVRFVGMHGEKAKLSVNRRAYLLKPGDVVKDRVVLMSATKTYAIVRIDGVNHLYKRGAKTRKTLPSDIVLSRDNSGMFSASGAINGKSVTFIVDTGATYVTLSSKQARQLKLRYKKDYPVKLLTASGTEKGHLTILESVRLGGIVQLGVEAVVLQGNFPDVILLGSSFLHRTRIIQTEAFMKIEE